LSIWAELSEVKASCDAGRDTYTIDQPVSKEEIERIVLTVAFAVMNSGELGLCSFNRSSLCFVVTVNWDVDRFTSKVNAGIFVDNERLDNELVWLRKYFELPRLGRSDEPATIVDLHGRILVWYLPDILSIQRVVRSQNPFLTHLLNCAPLIRAIIMMLSTTSTVT
jgi:hypothetical protein